MFTKPRGPRGRLPRERLGRRRYNNDLRIKMCIKPTEEDLVTIHHELGHDYYYHDYYKLPIALPGGRQRRLPRGDRRHARAVDHARLPEAARPARRRSPKNDKGRHQPADEGRARQDRVPAVRPADRPVALGRVRRQDQARPTTTRPGGSCARSTRASRRRCARTEDDFDPGAKYHVPANVAVHALLPRAHPPVPVPPGAVQGGRATRARCTSARSTATRRRARSSRRCSRWARASRGRRRCTR